MDPPGHWLRYAKRYCRLSARLHCSKSTLYTLGQTKDQVTVNVVRRFFRTATGQVESAVSDRRFAT
jgi:hypothetical protein